MIARLVQIPKKILRRLHFDLFPQSYHRKVANRWHSSKNIHADVNEQFYKRIYLHYINEKIPLHFGERYISILDAGCGQGRFSIPLAQKGHQVTGIDFSKVGLSIAQKQAQVVGVKIKFIEGELLSELRRIQDEAFDTVICAEVPLGDQQTYAFHEFFRLLKAGGLLISSTRSKGFYILQALKLHQLETARRILSNEEKLQGSYLKSYMMAELKKILEQIGFVEIEFRGIGCWSGLEGDPFGWVLQPKDLTDSERGILFEIETNSLDYCYEYARYFLTFGTKPHRSTVTGA